MIDIQYEPTDYNIGINVRYDACQTIIHLHVYLIPRYKGDVDNSRDDVRNLKSALGKYDE